VYFTAADARTSEERERDRLRDDVYAFDENYKLRQLWKIVVSTGAETQITSGALTVNEYRLSADGRRLAVQRAPPPYDQDAHRGGVGVRDAAGENARALTRNDVEERGIDISADGWQVLFLADTNARFEPYYPTSVFVVPAAGGEPRAVMSDFRYAIDQAAWAPHGTSIIASVNMGVHGELFEIDARSGRTQQLTDGARYVAPGWSIAPRAGRIVCQIDEPTRFGDVWSVPLGPASTPTRITGLFDALERDVELPRQEKVEWKGADGAAVEGILFYPIGYEA